MTRNIFLLSMFQIQSVSPGLIPVKAGDMLGIQYKGPLSGNGVVPYETSTQAAPLCCNLQAANLSRLVNLRRVDEQFNLGTILDSGLHPTTRIPALVAEVQPTN